MKKFILIGAIVWFLLLMLSHNSLTQPVADDLLPPTHFYTKALLFINEIELNPAGEDGGFQWVELFNASNNTYNLSNWIVILDVGAAEPLTVQLPEGTLVQPHEMKVIPLKSREEITFENISVELCDVEERVKDEIPMFSDVKDDNMCWARVTDGYEEWMFKPCTKGLSNLES